MEAGDLAESAAQEPDGTTTTTTTITEPATGKAFPANIAVNTSYTDSIQTVNSAEYEDMFNKLSKFFKEAFSQLDGYKETVIGKIQLPSKSRSSVPLSVTVTNVFTADSNVTNTSVAEAVQNATTGESYVSSYVEAKNCDVYQCDTKTTVCDEEGPQCKCLPDLEKTEWDDRSCSVISAQDQSRMVVFADEANCPVGYSGEDCADNTELILIIVGSVLGAIILILVIVVSVVSVRAKSKQNPESKSLIKSGYSDANTSDDRPRTFPRVQTTSGHTNPGYQPNNPYEMRSKNRDHYPERDYDDMQQENVLLSAALCQSHVESTLGKFVCGETLENGWDKGRNRPKVMKLSFIQIQLATCAWIPPPPSLVGQTETWAYMELNKKIFQYQQ
ncbi:mucin 13, cell surface associated [Turdus rufiventris]|nr:mucin 13, cell surface associated [Turdus rufiventris]